MKQKTKVLQLVRPDYDLQRRGKSRVSENLRRQSICGLCACLHQSSGLLLTECAFSQMACRRKPNTGMELWYKSSKHLKAGYNQLASEGREMSNHWSFRFCGRERPDFLQENNESADQTAHPQSDTRIG